MHSLNSPGNICSPSVNTREEFLESLPLACCIWDRNRRVIQCSEKTASLFSSGREEILGRTPETWQVINIEDKNFLSRQLSLLLEGKITDTVLQLTHKLKNRNVILCEWHLSAGGDTGDGQPCVLALVRKLSTTQPPGHGPSGDSEDDDLSTTRELEDQVVQLKLLTEILREKIRRQEQIMDETPIGMGVLNIDGKFTGEINRFYCDLLGYTREELANMTLEELTHPDDLALNQQEINALLTGKIDKTVYEKRYFCKSGKMIWARITASPVKDADGKVYNMIGVIEDITAEREAQRELKRSQILTRMGEEVAQIGFWSFQPGQIQAAYWSPQTYKIYEYDGVEPPAFDEIVKQVKPEYRERAWQTLEELGVEGKKIDYEVELTSFKGNEKWLRVVGEPQFDKHGNITKIYGAIQDITAGKKTEKDKDDLNSAFVSTLESMTDAFQIVNKDWRLVYMNSEAEKLLKATVADFAGQTIWEKIPYLRSTPIYDGYHRAMRNQEAFHCEFFSERLHDWLQVDAYPSKEGLAIYFRCTTERRELLAKIQESEERLKYVTRAILDVIWERDLLNGTILWNSGFQKFGYKSNHEEGQTLTDEDFWVSRIHPHEKDSVLKSMQPVLNGSSDQWDARYRFQKENGAYIYVQDQGVIVRDNEGNPIRMIGGMSDITDRIKMEEQIQQGQRIESVGKLTGGLAHDFNNLLTVIMGNTELLKNLLEDDTDLQKVTDSILNSAKRGAALTQRLLAFARRQALEPKATNINKLVLNMESLLLRTLGEEIRFNLKTTQELRSVLVDRNQLENALLNLCINARDAMQSGGEICIETSNEEISVEMARHLEDVMPGNYVAIKVKDNGVGMEKDLLEHVFEPFFTTKEPGKGTGLGLSTVFGFIKQSSGHIDIASVPGEGTVVTLYLPETTEVEQEEQSGVKQEYHQGNESILLVEDDPSVRSFTFEFLSSLGYTVEAAENALMALDIMRSGGKFDLLFTDVIMPGGMDGAELAREAVKIQPSLKILFTSGYTENALTRDKMLDPDVNLLAKPYTLSVMANKVREALG